MIPSKATSSFPVITLDKRIISEPVVVLAGYVTLAALISLTSWTIPQAGLAILLAVFGSGSSTVAVLFPRSHELDKIERIVLSACLSVAIGGITAYILARLIWGLQLWPFLVVTGLYNFVCCILVWLRRRNFSQEEAIIYIDIQKLVTWWKTGQDDASSLITTLLILLLFSGMGVFFHNLLQVPVDPPMTEFYLLGPGGETDNYPTTGGAGETFNIPYGIVNHENNPASYQVKVYIRGKEVSSSQSVSLNSGETRRGQIEFHLPILPCGQNKVEFALYREGKSYRLLYLWMDVSKSKVFDCPVIK